MKLLPSARRFLLVAGIIAVMAGGWLAATRETQASEVFRCGAGQSCVCVGSLWCTDQWEIGDECSDMWDCDEF